MHKKTANIHTKLQFVLESKVAFSGLKKGFVVFLEFYTYFSVFVVFRTINFAGAQAPAPTVCVAVIIDPCKPKCPRACETNLFVFGLASHQHLEHVAHRVPSHWRDSLPCDLARVALQLVHSGSCWGHKGT